MKSLTKNVTTPFAYFVILFVIGLTFSNIILLYVSLTPLFFILITSLFSSPSEIYIDRYISKKSTDLGDNVDIKLKIRVEDGLGLIRIIDHVPDDLSVEEDMNKMVVFKNFWPTTVEISYSIICQETGRHKIGNTYWESSQLFGLKPSKDGEKDNSEYITIKKHIKSRDDFKELHLGDIPTPRSSTSSIGIKTTDFKEIKNYTYGDPIKYINWKATARRGENEKPLVNEYEVEGKKCVWLFLDAASGSIAGRNAGKILSSCIEAADIFSRFFIDKGYLVGGYIYNTSAEETKIIYPERGKKHYENIDDKLSKISPVFSDDQEGLDEAVEECKNFIHRYEPLPIIITNISSSEPDNLKLGVKKLKSILGGKRKKKVTIFLLDVKLSSLELNVDRDYLENIRVMNEVEFLDVSKYVKRMGVNLIEWDPEKEDVSKSIMREVSRYKIR